MRSATDTDSLGSRSDNPESVRDRPDNIFIEANSEDSVVIEDFAFSKQQNFFNIPPDCKLPLNITNLSVGAPPCGDEESSDQLTPVITPIGNGSFFPHITDPAPAPDSLSLIEEVTEHSSCSTVKTSSSIARTNIFYKTPTLVRTATSHVPKILKPMSPRESPRDSTKSLRPRLRALDSTLPSKSQPSTPREDEAASEGKERFAKAKPRLVGRRFLRSSPPREMTQAPHQDPRPMADQPVQTKTGLTLTRPKKESESPPMSRCTSSASLLLHPPAGGLSRSLSRSSGSLVTSHPRPSFKHVESKVKQYIKDVKSLPRRELSKSCCNLSPPKNTLAVPTMSERPRTAEAAPTLRSYISSHHLEKIPRFQQKGNLQAVKSKSETNLQIAVDFVQSPLQISKSSMSLAFSNFDKLFESSGEESTRTTILKEKASDNMEEEEVTVFPEDLLAMVFQERQGKQETKKVLNELQCSYDQLLHKYAAAENALDKVRFGAKPPAEQGDRAEAFNMADKVADKIAAMEAEQRRQGDSFKAWLGKLEEQSRAESKVEVSSKEMPEELGVEQPINSLVHGVNQLELAGNSEMLGQVTSDEVLRSPLQSAIAKVERWQSSLPPSHTLPSCYGSLPTSPSPSPPPAPPPRPASPPDLDSGCPGSDRSTLYTSYLQSRGLSPSSKCKSRENLGAGTPLYTMPEEQLMVASPREILTQDTKFLTSVTIQSGVRLTPRAEAELALRRSNQPSPTACRLGPAMTSTPTSARVGLVRSDGFPDLEAVARGEELVHCPTDISSDEKQLREEVMEEERRMRLSLQCPPTPVKARTPRRCLFPGQTGQPQILAEQIDSEILELRNFFEDHREEMMSLLHGEEEQQRNISLPLFHQVDVKPVHKSSSMIFIPQQHEEADEEDRGSTPPLPNPYGLPYHSFTAPHPRTGRCSSGEGSSRRGG